MVAVVAHRGTAGELAEEHTLASYRRAIAEGVDGVECDVRLTADGHLVCVHDRRVDRTSSGRGLVSTLELADLEALRFGTWDGAADAEEPDTDAFGVLTLERLLELVVDCGRPVDIAVETKHPSRYAGLVERRVVELLDHFALTGRRAGEKPRSRVMSFSHVALRRVREIAPKLPTVYLMTRVPVRRRSGALPIGVTGAGPSIASLRADPGYPARARKYGHDVHVWTVDAPADVELCCEADVDVIVTNQPARVLKLLGRSRTTQGG